MKKAIFYAVIFLVHIVLSGCSAQRVVDTYNGLSVAMSGNKPPTFFKVNSVEEANNLKLTSKHFSVLMPTVKQDDFIKMGGWYGMNMYNGETISIGLNQHPVGSGKGVGFVHYDVQFSSFVYPYTERERAVEYKNKSYIQTHMQYGKNKYGREGNINVHYEIHGKEHYSCIVKESKDTGNGEYAISYDCHKFNPDRTMAKGVVISLTYTRVPNLPKKLEALANEYTYEDLQKRSQRILDSLYIKDGWEK